MKKIIIILGFSLFLNFANSNNEQFYFPDSKMGKFAKEWFNFMNSESAEYLLKYDKKREWEGHLSLIKKVSVKVGGIVPYLISYETSDFISIYSKETNGSWVIVNLGLNGNNEINASGIKKTFKPVDYSLRKNLMPNEIKAIVQDISYQLGKNYVVKKSRTSFSKKLMELLVVGKYDSITQGDLLAEMLTNDLMSISNDKHLQIIPPSRIFEVKSRFGNTTEKEGPTTKNEETKDISNIGGSILDNNIGYITLERFVHSQTTLQNTEKAFAKVADTKAIIIDLRNSGGGDGLAVANLLSYFFEKNELNVVYPDLDKIPSPKDLMLKSKLLEKPLYVLTSSKTISAGESFVYFLKNKKRATIIGEKTAGAGYRVDVFELSNGFNFVNSIYSSFDVENGEGWQGSGITPDLVTTKSKSMDLAITRILNKQ
ncbi:S41 family peptidase [uncultured Croceitalea sp.]|uniref:S41 family peptidase n=1 Tax=uncultured Croceitalea sp. TaxID=1798908 RepID=UPI003305AA75